MAARRLKLDRTLGPVVIRWIETNLVHGPGDVQGQRIQLDDEQVGFILRAYEVDDRGKRIVRRGVYSRPKGRAKSELAAMIACAEALGPVRFNGWGHGGRPEGRPVQAPYIPCVATEEGQAGNLYAAIEFMLKNGTLASTPGLDVGMTRTFLPDGGKIIPISAKATSKDGGKETFAPFDETHLYVTPELVRLHATIRRNLAKRKTAEPWSMETSTMYAPFEESVAELSHQYAEAIEAGTITDPGFLFDHREGPRDFDFADDDQLRAGLIEAYGAAAEWMDIDRLIAEARDPQTSEADFRRYFLNLATARDDSWLAKEWGSCHERDVKIPDGSTVHIGVDVGLVHDSTAVAVAWKREDGKVVVEAKVWTAKHDGLGEFVPGGVVNLEQIEDHIRSLAGRFNIEGLVYDPRFFERSAQMLGAEGIMVAPLHQSSAQMGDAYESFYAGVLEARIAHNADPIIDAHVRATAAVKSDRGWKVSKIKQNQRIDALVAAVMAHYQAALGNSAAPWALSW